MIKIIWNKYESEALFTDKNSIYKHNAAIKGGVYYFSNTKSTFTKCTFSHSTAVYGGAIYI